MSKRLDIILDKLHDMYPNATCALEFTSAHELLFATIMSAQTTDVNVNRVTSTLFQKYKTVRDFAEADLETFQDEIRSTGFFRNKAKHVIGAANMIVNEFQGNVPATMEDLLRLPGVARKTANVVLGTYFGIPVGFVVDTHVKRLSFRLGLTEQSDPVKIEQDVMGQIPQTEWIFGAHALVLHGRAVCDAKKPQCDACRLLPECPQNGI